MSVNSFTAGKHAFALLGDWYYGETEQYLFDNLGRQIWVFNMKRYVRKEKEVLKVSMENVYHKNLLSNLWSCNAEIELQVMNERGETVTKTMEHRFNGRSRRLDFGEITVRDYILPENTRQDVRCLFVVNIKINELAGIGLLLSNFASSQELDPPNSEVILAVGDQKLYVDKYGLMGCSSVFYEMFRKDIDMKKLEIRDVSVAQFLAFIRLIYKQEQQITLENVKSVLELAVRYDVAFLIEECVQFMVANEKIAISEKLRLAELYELSALEEDALKRQQALHESIVKVFDPLKENAVKQVKLFEEAKVEYKNFEQELERMTGEAEERLELIKIMQTAKPLGPHEQQILSAFQTQTPEKPAHYYRGRDVAGEYYTIWREIKERNSENYLYPVAQRMKNYMSSTFNSFKDEGVRQHRTFWDFAKVMQSAEARDMLEHIRKEEMKAKNI